MEQIEKNSTFWNPRVLKDKDEKAWQKGYYFYWLRIGGDGTTDGT